MEITAEEFKAASKALKEADIGTDHKLWIMPTGELVAIRLNSPNIVVLNPPFILDRP